MNNSRRILHRQETERHYINSNLKEFQTSRTGPWRKTGVAVEGHCQKVPESLEHQGGMGH